LVEQKRAKKKTFFFESNHLDRRELYSSISREYALFEHTKRAWQDLSMPGSSQRSISQDAKIGDQKFG